jgi:hypothetical protein
MSRDFIKIDLAHRTVSGIIAEEVPDTEGLIFDYASSKPYLKAWSENVSLGGLREMHTTKAAGKFVEIIFNDEAGQVSGTAFVVDESSWRKCLNGTFNCFGVCGGIIPLRDGRYTLIIEEVSLVASMNDPAMPADIPVGLIVAVPGWKNIESAPTDGTEILVFRQDAGVFTAWFVSPDSFPSNGLPSVGEDDERCWFTRDGEDLTGDMPTHWMPFPEPPAEASWP